MISLILRLSSRLHQDFHDSTLSQLSLSRKDFPSHFWQLWKAPDVSPLTNQLADRIGSIGLCAAHILPNLNRNSENEQITTHRNRLQVFLMWIYLTDEQLRRDTKEKCCQLKKMGWIQSLQQFKVGTQRFPLTSIICLHFLLDFTSPVHALSV